MQVSLVRGKLSETGRVYWITLERPEKLNALNRDMWIQLADELMRGCSSEAKLVALRGSGRAFCTGDDIKAMYDLKSREDAEDFFNALLLAVERLASCQKPVAAVVHGYAYGGCAEILLLMDYVVGVKGLRIAAPEASLGLIPPILSSLGHLMLGRRARWIALSGEPLEADEALELGLIDDIVGSVEEAVAKVEEKALKLEAVDPEAVAVTRRILFSGVAKALKESGALDELVRLTLTPKAKARMEAFLKRKGRS